jgi:hypothetical protein
MASSPSSPSLLQSPAASAIGFVTVVAVVYVLIKHLWNKFQESIPDSLKNVVERAASFIDRGLRGFDNVMTMSDRATQRAVAAIQDSIPRGAGSVMQCPPGTEKQAGLCYPKCREGFVGNGPMCWGTCPSGFTNGGTFCTKNTYGRGAGYPWKFGDGFSNDGMLARCAKDHPGGCEMWGAVAYPECRAGYGNAGCCLCTRTCPSGFTDTGATCEKPRYGRNAGQIPSHCTDDTPDKQLSLCYKACPEGWSGVGPVCWKKDTPLTSTQMKALDEAAAADAAAAAAAA